MKKQTYYRLFMALAWGGLIVFTLIIISHTIKIYSEDLSGFSLKLLIPAVVIADILLVIGLIASIGLMRRQEWARKTIIALAMLMLISGIGFLAQLLISNFPYLKAESGPSGPLPLLAGDFLKSIALALWSTATLYFAMACPGEESEPELAPSPEPEPRAR